MEFVTGNIDFLNDIDGSYRDDILTKSGKVTQKYKGKFILNAGKNGKAIILRERSDFTDDVGTHKQQIVLNKGFLNIRRNWQSRI